MTTLSGPGRSSRTIINDVDPAPKSPPVMTTGWLAWVRANLFRTPFDTVLTLVAGGLLVYFLYTFLLWAIGYANWFAITRNVRLFMVGTLVGDPTAVDRIQILSMIVAALVGFSVAAWWRVSRGFGIFVFVILALLLVIPALTQATVPLASSYVLAGDVSITSGTQTDRPARETAFIGREGDVINITFADDFTTDQSLTELYGFGDRPTDTLMNAARTRLDALARIDTLQVTLAETTDEDLYDSLNAELATLRELTELPLVEQFNLNNAAVRVAILSGDAETVLAETTLDANSQPLTLELPADGWYVLQREVIGEETAVLLQATGIYPHYPRQTLRPNAEGQARSVTEYIRMTDEFITEAAPPERDGASVPPMVVTVNQYRGTRTFTDWVRLHLAPFVEVLGRGLIPLTIIAIIAYGIGIALEKAIERRHVVRVTAWGWFLLPLVVFALVTGSQVNQWGGLFLTFMLAGVGIVASFPIGVLLALGRRAEGLPAIQIACTMFIEGVRGVPLITVLYLSQLALPLVSPALANVPNPVRAMVAITLFSAAYLAENVRGGLQSVPPGQAEAARALGLNSAQITLFITLPQALRAVIPALVGQFIALFKDTSLVAIVGLQELTNVALSVVAQTEYIGLRRETFLFISVIYFIFSYAMSYASRRLEASGAGAVRAREAA